MKFYIRYLGMRVETLDLDPGSYVIGRDPRSDILLTQSFISRKHARLFFENQNWWLCFYDDEGHESTPHKITSRSAIELGFDLDLVSEEFLSDEETVFDEPTHVVRERRHILRRTIVGVFLILLSIVVWLISTPLLDRAHSNKDPKIIFQEVRPMVVELVAHRSASALQEYKELAGFTDDDFKKGDGFCTGFIVAPDVVVTASHCIFGQNLSDLSIDFSIKTFDENLHQPQRILGFSLKKDYLFLEVSGLKKYGHLDLATKSQMGEKVFTVGNVHGEGIAIREGILSSKTIDPSHPDTEFIRYSAPASPGNSGGPLINVKGEVVALVFGVTSAENYNLGTPAAYLSEGLEKFADDRDEKRFDFVLNDSADLNVKKLLSDLSFPSQTALDERPDFLDEYKKIKLNLVLPVSFQTFDRYFFAELNESLSATFKSIEKKLLEQGLVNASWSSYLSESLPFILPIQLEKPFDQFVPGDTDFKSRYMAVLDGPTQSDFERMKQRSRRSGDFEFESFRYYLEVLLDEKGQWTYLSDAMNQKRRLSQYLTGQPYFSFAAKKKSEEVFAVADPLDLLHRFLGGRGLIVSPSTELIRPNSLREFVLKPSQKKFETVVDKDGVMRPWIQYSTSYFNSFDFTSFCTQAPQGQWCVSRLFDFESEAQLEVMKKNYLQYWLPTYQLAPHFWDTQNLISYLGSESVDPVLRDFSIERSDSKFTMQFKSSGLNFSTSALEPLAIRPTYALSRVNGESRWEAQSFDLLVLKGKEWNVCGGGFEIDGQKQSRFLQLWSEVKKSQTTKQGSKRARSTKVRTSVTPNIWMKEDSQLADGRVVNIYGYCVTLKREKSFYNLDWEEIRPYQFAVVLNQ